MKNNTPDCVRAVLDKPGKYLWRGGSIFQFEVDDKGQVHQLTLDGKTRDGILEPEGWTCPVWFGEVFPLETE